MKVSESILTPLFAGLTLVIGYVPALALSDGAPNLAYWLERTAAVIVAVPVEAKVVESPAHPQGEIHAKLELLDVLKGEAPKLLPTLVGSVDPIGSCESPIPLGSAIVFFLDAEGGVNLSPCSPGGVFVSQRMLQEEFCYENHPSSEHCYPAYLQLLRNANNTNAKYGFDEDWMSEQQKRIQRRVQSLNRWN